METETYRKFNYVEDDQLIIFFFFHFEEDSLIKGGL